MSAAFSRECDYSRLMISLENSSQPSTVKMALFDNPENDKIVNIFQDDDEVQMLENCKIKMRFLKKLTCIYKA